MLSLLCEIDCASARSAKLHNLFNGIELLSFFKANAATIFTIAKHRSHAANRAESRQG